LLDEAPAATPEYRGGSGPPLLLLHGFASTWRAWRPVLPLLEGTHTVLAPTLPGHSGAPGLPPGSATSVQAIADELERMLDAERIDRAHVSGNSMGGWLALELARRGRARSVVALSPGGAWSADSRMSRTLAKVRLSARAMRLAGDRLDGPLRRPKWRRVLFRDMVEHGDRIDPAEARAAMRDLAGCPIFQPLIASMMNQQLDPIPDIVDCAIRIAWAERDRVIPPHRFLPAMRERVPGAEFMILPRVGHVPMSDNPELVATTILDVTRSASAQDGA
jgi:pimeloyl-ACP methyl ester carboxylesterase